MKNSAILAARLRLLAAQSLQLQELASMVDAVDGDEAATRLIEWLKAGPVELSAAWCGLASLCASASRDVEFALVTMSIIRDVQMPAALRLASELDSQIMGPAAPGVH